MDYYECDQCGAQTTVRDAIHINYRMEFDPGFGTYRRERRLHCCYCTERIGGQTCDHEAGLWS